MHYLRCVDGFVPDGCRGRRCDGDGSCSVGGSGDRGGGAGGGGGDGRGTGGLFLIPLPNSTGSKCVREDSQGKTSSRQTDRSTVKRSSLASDKVHHLDICRRSRGASAIS